MEGNFLQLRSAEMAYYGRFRESQALGARQVELLKRQGLPQRARPRSRSRRSAPRCWGNLPRRASARMRR